MAVRCTKVLINFHTQLHWRLVTVLPTFPKDDDYVVQSWKHELYTIRVTEWNHGASFSIIDFIVCIKVSCSFDSKCSAEATMLKHWVPSKSIRIMFIAPLGDKSANPKQYKKGYVSAQVPKLGALLALTSFAEPSEYRAQFV